MKTPNELFDLKGRTALVTGSSRGIVAAIARGLASAGAHVIVHGQSINATEETSRAISLDGGSCSALAADLSQSGAGSTLIEACESEAGQLDILVINASAQINASLADLTEDDFSFQVNVNLRSTIEMLRSCLPCTAQRGWGRVVNIGSINQFGPKPIVTAYAANKAAQNNLIQSQARAYAKTGVVLNTLAPGLVDTDRNAERKLSDADGWANYVAEANWMGRAGQTYEMVGAALFLATEASSFMTGEVLTLSGGY